MIGYAGKNLSGCSFVVTALAGRNKSGQQLYRVLFQSGWEAEAPKSAIIKGHVKDRLHPLILGVACTGHFNPTADMKTYQMWRNMITRCYDVRSKDYPAYGGRSVYVCDRWLRADLFQSDLPLLPGYNDVDFHAGVLVLDKDILQPDANVKVYSPETCMLVSPTVNGMHRNTKSYARKFLIKRQGDEEWQSVFGIVNTAKIIGVTPSALNRRFDKGARYIKGIYKDWLVELAEG